MQQAQQLQVRVLSCIALVLCFGSPVWAYPEELMCMSSDLCSVGKTKQFKGDIASIWAHPEDLICMSSDFCSVGKTTQFKGDIASIWAHPEDLICMSSDFCSVGKTKQFKGDIASRPPVWDHPWVLMSMSSDLRSIGKTKQFKGDIASSGGFKSALESVSYKKEIIVVTIAGQYHLEMLLQLRADFEELGFAHFLILTRMPDQCDMVLSIKEDASCAWDSSAMHQQGFSGSTLLWHLRWRFIARASRLGYNVMSLDRWMDDNFQLLSTWGKQKQGQQMCLTFDQSFLDDALHSTIADGPDWVAPGEGGCKKGDCQAAHRDLVQCQDKTTKVSMPPPDFWPPPLPAACPWWADSDPADKEKAHAIKEIFGFAPNWIWTTSSWMRHGLGTPIDGSRPRQVPVAVHAHAPAGTSKNSKLAVRKFLARFQWNLSNDLHHTGKLHSRGPYFHGRRPAQRVLLLDPAVDLSRTANHLEMKMIIQGLIEMKGTSELDYLSNRTLVYPDVPPCWLDDKQQGRRTRACRSPEMSKQGAIPYAALDEPWKGYDGQRSYRMVNPFLWEDDCFRAGHFRG
eukprot:gene4843-34599_t